MPEDDSPQCSCCIIFPTTQESETRKNKGLAGLSVTFMFRLNFQLGKCEFFSDDKGRGTDIVRCCFRNDKLLSVPDCHLLWLGVNPEPDHRLCLPFSTFTQVPSWWQLSCSACLVLRTSQLDLKSRKVPPDKPGPPKTWLSGWKVLRGLPLHWPFSSSRRTGNSRHMFALPKHCARGRSNNFQKHQACFMPAGCPRLSGSSGCKPSCQTGWVVTGVIPPRQPLVGESGEKGVRKLQAASNTALEPLTHVVCIKLCILGGKSTILFLEIR